MQAFKTPFTLFDRPKLKSDQNSHAKDLNQFLTVPSGNVEWQIIRAKKNKELLRVLQSESLIRYSICVNREISHIVILSTVNQHRNSVISPVILTSMREDTSSYDPNVCQLRVK